MTTIAEIELLAEATEALPEPYQNDGTDLTLVAHGTAVLCANWGAAADAVPGDRGMLEGGAADMRFLRELADFLRRGPVLVIWLKYTAVIDPKNLT